MSQAQNASRAQEDKVDKIMTILQMAKTPAEMYEFLKSVERLMEEHAGCKDARFWEDDDPRIEQEERLDSEIEHAIEHHVDTLVCNGREFEVEAVYEVYYVYCGDSYRIVHSFKPIRVQERKEPKLKPKLESEETTPAEALIEALRFILSAGIMPPGIRSLNRGT